MDLEEYGQFDDGVFYFREPFPFFTEEGVTLLAHLDYRRLSRVGISPEQLVRNVLKDQIGIPDPLRKREPNQETPKTEPGA